MKKCLDCSIQLKDYRSVRCNKCRAKAFPMVFTDELRLKMSLARRGKKFKPHSEETKEKMRLAAIKNGNKPVHNKPHSEETKEKISKAKLGSIPWNKTNDVEEKLWKKRLRGTVAWKDWRVSIFKRDNYTCQECLQKGGILEPHHIIPVRSDRENLFNTNNGITLCRPCHQKTIWKESDFAEKYFAIIAAQV